MKSMVIVGAGAVGRFIAAQLRQLPTWRDAYRVVGFIDNDPRLLGSLIDRVPVLGGIETLRGGTITHAFVALATPSDRRKTVARLRETCDLVYPSLVHPKAWLDESVTVGEGCVIYPGVCINVSAKLKDFVIVNMGCSIGHDVMLGHHTTLSPGVSMGGKVQVGDEAFIGIGASVIQGLTIGASAVVGAGSTVIDDVASGVTVVGTPAREITKRGERR